MPPILRILETALYVDDMERAVAFYREVMGLSVLTAGPRLTALDAGQGTVLLLFQRGESANGVHLPDGAWIAPHDGSGPLHFAFATTKQGLSAWEAHLATHGVAIENRLNWERGGQSIYFRDPDGHSVELATPGTWATF